MHLYSHSLAHDNCSANSLASMKISGAYYCNTIWFITVFYSVIILLSDVV